MDTLLQRGLTPPQVVKVKTFSSEHGQLVRVFVVDGMTRTKFAFDHRETGHPSAPDYSFSSIAVKDVTDSDVNNPLIVPLEEREDNQQSLTMLQYLRAVVPPTREHSQIANDRIAAHLVNAWDNMVGENLAKKYSAIAALSFVSRADVPTATDREFQRFLVRQREFVAGQIDDEKASLIKALREMASIIREARLSPRKHEVARAAFFLVSEESPVIGGPTETERQIHGLLYLTIVEKKLADMYPDVESAKREEERFKLGKYILEFTRNIQELPPHERENRTRLFFDILNDQDVTWDHVLDIFTSEDPSRRYSEVKKAISRDKLQTVYLTVSQKGELSALEDALLDHLGQVTNLDEDRVVRPAVRAIREAVDAFNKATALQKRIQDDRQRLIHRGVSADTLNNALAAFQNIESSILSAASPSAVSRAATELKEAAENANREITWELATKRVQEMVDETMGGIIQSSDHPEPLRESIINFIARSPRVDLLNLIEQRVKTLLDQLAGLDADLRSNVISSRPTMTLEFATEEQRRRNERRARLVTPPPSPVEPPQPSAPVSPVGEPPGEVPTQPPVAGRTPTPTPTAGPEPVRLSAEETARRRAEEERRRQEEEQRKREINATFVQSSSVYYQVLRSLADSLKLKKEDLNPESQEFARVISRELGKVISGDHDAVAILVERYPQLLKDVIRLREELVYLRNEIAERDTRTGR